MADREPRNNNRIDLYRKLLPNLIREDQDSGAQGFVMHWDDADADWDSGAVADAWDALGLSPVYQELFWVLEKMGEEDLVALESLDALVDPLNCPEESLGLIAASFGYGLDEDQPEALKRQAVQGLMEAYKSRGTAAGFQVFFRLVGFRLVEVFPLWKKEILEDRNDYSRLRYDTTDISEAIGPSGNTTYTGVLSDAPIKPGSLRITDGTVIIRDDLQVAPESVSDIRGYGNLIGPTTESGTVNYSTGEFTVTFTGATAADVTSTYERVDEEWPYHAARIDVDINISSGGAPVPLLEADDLDVILRRLDDVRPIHVLLRSLAIVVELTDDFSPGASDQWECATLLKTVLSGVPSLGILGKNESYMLDGALRFANYPGGDQLAIFQDLTVGTDIHQQALEDLAPIVCPLDVLTIEGPPGGPFYA